MSNVSRRRFVGSSVGLGAALVPAAHAADHPAAQSEPPALLGAVRDGHVSLPPLHAPSEQNGTVPNPMPLARRLGVAVVGLGHLSLENILPAFGQARSVRLAALVSGEPAKAEAVAAEYGVDREGLYTYRDFDRIRDNQAVDIVYIVLPNALHEEFTIRAARAGKHVLSEKPMADTAAAAERMIAACSDAHRSLMVAYRLQYDEAHRTLIGLARQKHFGTVRLIEAVNGQNDLPDGQWRQIRALAGGGSLPDVGLYCFNAFRYLTGEEPVCVTGITTHPAGDRRFREVEDIAMFTLRFPSGIVATGTSGYSFHSNRQLRVSADEAWFGLDPAFGYDNLTLQIGRKAGMASSLDQRRFTPKNQFAVEMDAFAASLASGQVPHTPGEEGLADMRIMEAIYRSARQGGAPVHLPQAAPAGTLDATRGPWPAALGPLVPA